LSMMFLFCLAYSEEICHVPESRLFSWKPGVKDGIPNVPVQIVLSADELKGDAAAALIQKALLSVTAPGAVLLPQGEFRISSRIKFSSGVVLRGAGPSKTILRVELPEGRGMAAFQFKGSFSSGEIPIRDAPSGSRSVCLEAGAVPGDATFFIISSENLKELMITNPAWDAKWAKRSLGQVFEGTVDEKGRISLSAPLRLSHEAPRNPQIRAFVPVRNSGLEDLSIRRLDSSEDSVVQMELAVDCWLKNVESSFCKRAHVWISDSLRISVESSIFHHAHDYGGGGHGYGVVAGRHATDCLVSDNIFYHLRHSMMSKEGASGNVFSYNYSFDNVPTFGILGRLCDISVHGHYSLMNLFEGNVVEFVNCADYWGPAGPRTTFFRNRVASLFLVKDKSREINVLANSIGGALLISPDCIEPLSKGNTVSGKPLSGEDPAGIFFPASFYLKGKPSFWGDCAWPAIGPDVEKVFLKPEIPAQKRWRLLSEKSSSLPAK